MVDFDGFVFDDIHNNDIPVSLPSGIQIGYPDKKKNKIRVTGTNIIYDFSEVNGEQEYEERRIEIPLNIIDFNKRDYRSTHIKATKVFNWLMGPNGQRKLMIDKLPDFYFMAEVVNGPKIQTDLFEYGMATVEFLAYPYKFRSKKASNRAWADFVFSLDVRQDTSYTLPLMTEQLPYKLLQIGDLVTLGGWSQYASGANVKFNKYQTSRYYMISEIREVNDVDHSSFRYDKTQYFLPELDAWVRSQDIVQARNTYVEADLYTSSAHSILPEIKASNFKSGNLGGFTIEKGGQFYNFKSNEENRHLPLDKGSNVFKIYGQAQDISFDWRDEVL